MLPHIDGIGDAADGGIVPLQPPSPKRERFHNNFNLHIAQARAVVVKNRLQRKLNAATAQVARRDELLQITSAMLLGGPSLVPKAKVRCIAKILMANLKPADFALATRAMHLNYKVQANVGVKLRKFLCAGARAVRRRQRQGVKRFFDGSARALHQHDEGKHIQVHIAYRLPWDEVRAKFR